jgi:hypothetical protein
MFTLLASDEDDEEYEVSDPIEIAQLFCAVAGVAIGYGFDRDDLIALLDAELALDGAERN